MNKKQIDIIDDYIGHIIHSDFHVFELTTLLKRIAEIHGWSSDDMNMVDIFIKVKAIQLDYPTIRTRNGVEILNLTFRRHHGIKIIKDFCKTLNNNEEVGRELYTLNGEPTGLKIVG